MEILHHTQGSREASPKLLFKVTLMRHEKPYYKDEGHDLTPEGVQGAKRTGKRFKDEGIISEGDEIFLASSPKARAKGTLGFVAEGAGLEALPRVEINQLRSSDMPDYDTFAEKYIANQWNLEVLARDHYKDPMFQDRPDIVEPHLDKKDRLYRSFEYLIRWFDEHPSKDKTSHLIAVSHFEVITHLIDDVFGIENMAGYNTPAFGEAIYIEAYNSDDKDKVLLKVTYNEQSREVYFDRKTRSIELR